MAKKDKRIDAYIAQAPEFAKPILEQFRAAVHEGCPDVEEDIKWGGPFFLHQGILCGMAAFKAHCALIFWKARLVTGASNGRDGPFARITSLAELPPRKVLVGDVKKAVEVNENRTATAPRRKRAVAEPDVPADLTAALGKNKKARTTFEAFSPSARREYVDWITEAKTDTTRQRRLAQALEWMAEGKQRNWKYM